MKDVPYLIIVVLITSIILAGLFIYNKGSIQELSGTLTLSNDISLNFERVLTKPAESNRYRIILYAKAINNSSKQATLKVDYPVNPCSTYNTYYQNQKDNQIYQQCLSSTQYQDYLQKQKEYNEFYSSGAGGLELMTPQNQKCNLDGSYQINSKYPNIGPDITSYTFQPNETKVGSIVFDCSEQTGEFTIKFRSESLKLDI